MSRSRDSASDGSERQRSQVSVNFDETMEPGVAARVEGLDASARSDLGGGAGAHRPDRARPGRDSRSLDMARVETSSPPDAGVGPRCPKGCP
jgi:hypothetical protein